MSDDEDAPLARPLPPLTWRDVVDRAVPPDRAARARLIAGAVVVVLVAVAGWWILRPPPAPATELSLPYAGQRAGGGSPASATSTTAAEPEEVVVHAAGAVVAPGLHRLPAGARVADLLDAAGGPAPEADLDRVNLAAPLADGERVWFPRLGEEAPPEVAGSSGGDGAAAAAAGGGAAAGPIDINTATAEQLAELPGVGPSIAAAIVRHREEVGPFRSVDDLLDVSGIGPARLEQLRGLVTV